MSMYRYLDVSEHDDTIIVRIRAHRLLVDQWLVTNVGDELEEVAARSDCYKLVVDLSGVVDLSSLMLGLLVMLRRKMASKRGHLVLCGLNAEVQEFFDETMLSQLLEIRANEAEALAELV